MGNHHSNSRHRDKSRTDVQISTSNKNEISHQHSPTDERPAQSTSIGDENIYVMARSGDDTSEYSSSTIASSVSASDAPVRGVQHIIRDSVNNYYVHDATNTHIGDSIHCYSAVSFVTTNQSNIQINNQQNISMVHDFGNFD